MRKKKKPNKIKNKKIKNKLNLVRTKKVNII